MRYGKIAVYLFTLLFAALVVVLWALEPRTEERPVDLILTSTGEEKIITSWKNEAGEYYFFLPTYADSGSAYLRIHGRNVRIDGRLAEDGMSCGVFSLDTPYPFSFDSGEGQVSTVLTFVQSKDLPTLYIDTGSGNMDHIHGKKGNQETGSMCLYLPDGELAHTGNLDAINGRGNDWLIPKKSYSLQLAAAADLLGMGQAEKWILLANAFDGSHLRNKLVYDFADALGLAFSPDSRWVDLYLNGEYAGLYLLSERNELHEQRVSLTGEGSYLVSMDVGWRLTQNHKPFLTTDDGYAFRIHSSQLGETTLQRLLQSVENAIFAENGRDPLTGKHWTELIDVDSWVKKYLVEEIFGNSDGGAISQYFYGSSQEDRMYAGPVWDYDISMGNSQAQRVSEPQTIQAGRSRIWSNSASPSWFYGLCRQETFYGRMVQVYRETCLPLLDTFLDTRLTEYTAQIAQASAMNQIRWNTLSAYWVTAAAEAENIHNYMEMRIAFLNQLWLERETFHRVLIDAGDGGFTLCFAVRPGEQIPFLPEYEPLPEIQGWYIADSEEPFDMSQPIWEDMEITLRRTESGEAAAETENDVIQYMPFAVLLGILGTFCLLDGSRRKQKSCACKTDVR